MGNGGPRREKVPDTDLSHLQDVLAEHVQNEGNFSFTGYKHQLKAQAILGADLAENSSLMKKLMQVQPALLFRYADLKNVMGKIVQRFSSVRESFPISQQEKAAAKLSNSLMTMCTHTRRLRDSNRLREACSTLAAWQSSKLEELRDMLNFNQPSSPKKPKKEQPSSSMAMVKAKDPSTPKKTKKTHDDEEATSIASLDTVDAMEIELPLTQESTMAMMSSFRLRAAPQFLPGSRQ